MNTTSSCVIEDPCLWPILDSSEADGENTTTVRRWVKRGLTLAYCQGLLPTVLVDLGFKIFRLKAV